MGESKMKDLPEIGYWSYAQIYVLWNFEDYPTPSGADLGRIRLDISEALARMGFFGNAQLHAFGAFDEKVEKEFLNAGFSVFITESSTDGSVPFKLPMRMIQCAYDSKPATVILVIAKEQSPESELHRVEQCLTWRNHPILVLVDDGQEASPLLSAQSLVDCTRVFGGGKPVFNRPPEADGDFWDSDYKFLFSNIRDRSSKIIDYSNNKMEDEDFSDKMEDIFSKRITLFKGGPSTFVFWDVVDCPFPSCSNPHEIYSKISKALRERGGDDIGHLSICAYVDDHENNDHLLMLNKTWDSSIYFLPGGDNKLHRIFNDILLWRKDCFEEPHPEPAILIVVSSQFKEDPYFYGRLESLNSIMNLDVYLITPTQQTNQPESPGWPGLLLDHPEYPERETGSSEPALKKQRPDADADLDAGSGDL